MKTIILLLLFTGCAHRLPIVKPEPQSTYNLFNEIQTCIHKLVDKGKTLKEANEVCTGIFKEGN